MLLQVIDITKRTLVITREFGNPLLSQCSPRGEQRKGQKYSDQKEGWRLHWRPFDCSDPRSESPVAGQQGARWVEGGAHLGQGSSRLEARAAVDHAIAGMAELLTVLLAVPRSDAFHHCAEGFDTLHPFDRARTTPQP